MKKKELQELIKQGEGYFVEFKGEENRNISDDELRNQKWGNSILVKNL